MKCPGCAMGYCFSAVEKRSRWAEVCLSPAVPRKAHSPGFLVKGRHTEEEQQGGGAGAGAGSDCCCISCTGRRERERKKKKAH